MSFLCGLYYTGGMQKEKSMNEILAKLEEMNLDDLTDIFIYLTDLINYRKEQEKLNKKLLKRKENLITNSRAKCTSVQNAES